MENFNFFDFFCENCESCQLDISPKGPEVTNMVFYGMGVLSLLTLNLEGT